MTIFYEERVPPLRVALRRLGGRATAAELWEEVKGDGRFGKQRRIPATFRWDKRQRHPMFAREGNVYSFRNNRDT